MSHPHHRLWRLNAATLTPTTQALQAFTIHLRDQPFPDPLLTLRFANTADTLIIRRSALATATPELRALVTPPFLAPTADTLTLRYESADAFRVIRDYLYLLPVHMPRLTPRVALAAERWGLHHLFHAYLYFVRAHQFATFDALVAAVLPLMQHPRLPASFRRVVAFRLAASLHHLRSWLAADAPRHPGFRHALLWQALHKQRIVACFIKYVHRLHHASPFDYLSFASHGLRRALEGAVTPRERMAIMSRAVHVGIPRTPVCHILQRAMHRPAVRVRMAQKSAPADGVLAASLVGRVVVRGLADVKLICDGERDGKIDGVDSR